MPVMMNRHVVIVQRVLADYRIPLFDALASKLASDGVRLNVLAGQARVGEFLEEPDCDREWLIRTRNIYMPGGAYIERRVVHLSKTANLLIVEQASKALVSYWLLLRRYMSANYPKVAYWGHGIDFADQKRFSFQRLWKRTFIDKVDHWFAYTDATARILMETGYSPSRITIFNNASDTNGLSEAIRAIPDSVKSERFESLWHEPYQPCHKVGVFCSRLLPSKAIRLLLDASTLIAQQHSGFRLLVIGDGPERANVESFAAKHSWCALHPPLYGLDRASFLALADVWLNPGTTGLAILDAYAAGIPYITTARPDHGPEIAYIDSLAGVMTPPDAIDYTKAVSHVLQDNELQRRKSAAVELSRKYTLEQTVQRLASGIVQVMGKTNKKARL